MFVLFFVFKSNHQCRYEERQDGEDGNVGKGVGG